MRAKSPNRRDPADRSQNAGNEDGVVVVAEDMDGQCSIRRAMHSIIRASLSLLSKALLLILVGWMLFGNEGNPIWQ